LEWLETIRQDLAKARVIKLRGAEGTYDYIINPLSSGAPALPTEALWGCAFEIARVSDVRGARKILAPEAMGIHVATALCMVTGKPLLVIRKKPYHLPGEITITKETGYAREDMYINDVNPGDHILLVDSIIATGGTYVAIIEALRANGVHILDAVAVIERVELGGVEFVKQQTDVEVKTLVKVGLKDGVPYVM
jgi:adenine phosphoribosyltransferase